MVKSCSHTYAYIYQVTLNLKPESACSADLVTLIRFQHNCLHKPSNYAFIQHNSTKALFSFHHMTMSGKAPTVTSTGKTSTTHKPASTSSSRSQIGGSPQRQQQQHAQTQQEKKHHEAFLTDRTRPQASTKESQRIPRSVPSKGSFYIFKIMVFKLNKYKLKQRIKYK